MLANQHDRQTLEEALSMLDCGIVIPPEWFGDTEKRGPLPGTTHEMRRFSRFYYQTRAILHSSQSLPALPRPEQKYIVYTKNLSRQGVAFLHVEQLFPGEKLCIWLPGGALKEMMVIRCVKRNDRCYQVGACFL